MPNGARNWCFTLNNYTDDEISLLRTISSQVRYLCFQKEIGQEGTPHLQGFISFKKQTSLRSVKALVSNRAHFEISKGSPKQNRDYCSKSDSGIEGSFEEFGELPGPSGQRNDLDEFKKAVKNGDIRNKRDCRELYSDVYAKYPKFCSEYLGDHPRPPPVDDHELKEWQTYLWSELEKDPDDRSIVFVVDPQGNQGKTWFCKKWFSANLDNSQILEPAKKADMAYSLRDDLRVLFVNLTRSFSKNEEQTTYLYSFLESVKDGLVFSPKYESGMKYLEKCHVVVMMNEEPQRILSRDRYVILNI